MNKWFDEMAKLESHQLTKGDYYSQCWDLPPQLGGTEGNRLKSVSMVQSYWMEKEGAGGYLW